LSKKQATTGKDQV